MEVKIIKAKRSSYWYAKLIGQTIEIPDDYTIDHDSDYKFLYPNERDGEMIYHYIGVDDCEIISHGHRNTHGDSKLKFYFI